VSDHVCITHSFVVSEFVSHNEHTKWWQVEEGVMLTFFLGPEHDGRVSVDERVPKLRVERHEGVLDGRQDALKPLLTLAHLQRQREMWSRSGRPLVMGGNQDHV
jgi:hypothetical protein